MSYEFKDFSKTYHENSLQQVTSEDIVEISPDKARVNFPI